MLCFYNTAARRKEPFVPLNPPRVTLYTCGPTVYNRAHLGNFRTFLFEDVLRRYLCYRGYEVTHVMNITDVDDKTIRDSKKAGLELGEFTRGYTELFFEDLDFLGIRRADHYPLATEHIPEMLELMARLEQGGHTYVAEGSVYFAIATFPEYGRLSGVALEGNRAGARYEADEYEKDDVRDFVLWKARKEDEPFWDSPYGPGRPGWHLECSAMARKYLGDTIDLHCGGIDLVFPHHENELAQSEAANGKPFVRCWMHGAFLNLKKEKMSKSLGNIVSLAELRERGHSGQVVRALLLSAHYRSTLYFDLDELTQAAATVARIEEALRRLEDSPVSGEAPGVISAEVASARERFVTAMDDDLNVPEALGSAFGFIRTLNAALQSCPLSSADREAAKTLFSEYDQVLGLFHREQLTLEAEVEHLIAERLEARKQRDFKRADAIRASLADRGIELIDTPQGTRWKKA